MRLALLIAGRPLKGLDEQINLITQKQLIQSVKKASKNLRGRTYVTDNQTLTYESGLRKRNIPIFSGLISLIKIGIAIRNFGRRESSIDITIRVIKDSIN
jgi:hypothetical protein